MKSGKLKILEIDPLLKPFEQDLLLRMENYQTTKQRLMGDQESLSALANGHLYFGLHRTKEGWFYREWAPNALEITLIGDFNDWNHHSHPLAQVSPGVWEVFIPGRDALQHASRVKVRIVTDSEVLYRIPLYCRRVIQDANTLTFDGQVWAPARRYHWTDEAFYHSPEKKSRTPLIYECHIGMAGEEPVVHTFEEFTKKILPRVKRLGYNTIQLMAIMEHPYYASFGYQVSNFFAVSSRFGTPEDLKRLINTAHNMGIAVLLDLVHSHTARNEAEGIARFDGTVYQFFHDGAKGDHPNWGTKLFNYGKNEVLHFLLSNLKFWLEEYHFDGFRFDGVTSMLYHDHGIGDAFDHYKKYFSLNTDLESIAYLQLAAELCKEVDPNCILIAEDMSGMPGMCLPVEWGGIGFDYRLGMGAPDFWIRTLRERKDEEWEMGGMWHELTQRRPQEKVIGYCESHDQALVGDKTIMFWLADKEMYWNMHCDSKKPPVDRAIALHKMIRLITCTCAGEGYLTFMGNEFGHPEWIDFPREGNDWSYHHARRLWSLAEDETLRYHFLEQFDIEMLALVQQNSLLSTPGKQVYRKEKEQMLGYQKGDFLFLFNFHPVNDHTSIIYVEEAGSYEVILHTSWSRFGGYTSEDKQSFKTKKTKKGAYQLHIPLHRRTAIVCRRKAKK